MAIRLEHVELIRGEGRISSGGNIYSVGYVIDVYQKFNESIPLSKSATGRLTAKPGELVPGELVPCGMGQLRPMGRRGCHQPCGTVEGGVSAVHPSSKADSSNPPRGFQPEPHSRHPGRSSSMVRRGVLFEDVD